MKLLKFKDGYEYNFFKDNIGGVLVELFLFRIKDIHKKFSDKQILKLVNLTKCDVPIVDFKYEYKCKHHNFLTPLWIRRELDPKSYGASIMLLDMKTCMSETTQGYNTYLLATPYPRDEYIKNNNKNFDNVIINTFIPYTNISIFGSFIKNTELETYADIPRFNKAYSYMCKLINYDD